MFWRYIQLVIYWASFLVWVFLGYVISRIVVGASGWWWLWLVLSLLFIYARFVEPYLLRVRMEKIRLGEGARKVKKVRGKVVADAESVRMVLISDLHLGVFQGVKFLEKILAKIEELEADLVVIPGDLINDPSEAELKLMFAPFKNFKIPVYAVTGNHDSRKPGYHESEVVRQMLRKFGVNTIDNAVAIFDKGHARLHLYGLSDLMEGKADFSILEKMRANQHNIIVAHNPDAACDIGPELPAKLLVSGHTHAGQIQIPFIYKKLIPCKFDFERGWYTVNKRKVYVSSGLGMVLLPMRLGAVPEIVVMDLEI